MLFQFPHPLLTEDHKKALRVAILAAAPVVTVIFYPPFGMDVSQRPAGTIDPVILKRIRETLKKAADAWR